MVIYISHYLSKIEFKLKITIEKKQDPFIETLGVLLFF